MRRMRQSISLEFVKTSGKRKQAYMGKKHSLDLLKQNATGTELASLAVILHVLQRISQLLTGDKHGQSLVL